MNKNKIITVTLNPSMDKTVLTKYLNLGYHNRVVGSTRLDASGRGVNVSHALAQLGANTNSVILLGNKAIGRAYRALISEEAFDTYIVSYDGLTRNDNIIVDTATGTETHIIDEGASCTDEDLQNVLDAILKVAEPSDTVLLAGELPRGSDPKIYGQMTSAIKEKGAKVAIFASGEALNQSLSAGPEMVALTRLQTESLFNYPVRTFEDMLTCGQKLRDSGAHYVLIVAETFESAVLVSESDSLIMEINDLAVEGTDSGVIDAMLAGYLFGLEQGLSTRDSFELGAASLAYTASRIGNKFGTLDDVRALIKHITITSAEQTSNIQA